MMIGQTLMVILKCMAPGALCMCGQPGSCTDLGRAACDPALSNSATAMLHCMAFSDPPACTDLKMVNMLLIGHSKAQSCAACCRRCCPW